MTQPVEDAEPVEDDRTFADVARELADAAQVQADAAKAAARDAELAARDAARQQALASAAAASEAERQGRYASGAIYEGPLWQCLPCGLAVVDRDVHDSVAHPVDWRSVSDPGLRRELRAQQRPTGFTAGPLSRD